MHEADVYTDSGRHYGGDFMMGLLCGAAIGAAVGLLFAPRPGAELRTQLSGSAERLGRQAADTYARASDAVNDFVDRGREAARRGRDKFDEVRSDFSRAAEKAGRSVEEQAGI